MRNMHKTFTELENNIKKKGGGASTCVMEMCASDSVTLVLLLGPPDLNYLNHPTDGSALEAGSSEGLGWSAGPRIMLRRMVRPF